jgi:hypothetical protein
LGNNSQNVAPQQLHNFLKKGQEMNIGKLILGGIVAAVIYFIGDGVVHGALLKQHWGTILGAINVDAEKALKTPAVFGVYDLIKGFAAVWIYAAIRPRLGPGPGTATIAGLVVWVLAIPAPLIGLLPMKFFPAGFVGLWAVYAIVPSILGAVIGAWLYKEQ